MRTWHLLGILLACFVLLGCLQPRNPWEGMNTGTGAGNVSCGVNLDVAGATYTMNNSSTSTGTCFTVTAANVTLDCKGYTITGNNAANSRGVYSTVFNTTIKNCNISTFTSGITFYTGTNGTVMDTNITSNYATGYGIFLYNSANYHRISNVRMNCTYACLLFDTGSSFNVISNSMITGGNSNGAVSFILDSRNNTIANSTINAQGASNYEGMKFQMNANTGNLIINNTIFNGGIGVDMDALAGGNTFCLNNFTSLSSSYIYDLNGTNSYNCTYGGKNQGNIYANVLNGSIEVTGTNASSIAGLYIGDTGAGVPYTNISSSGKFACNFTACKDYVPLTLVATPTNGNLTVNYTSGGTAVGNNSVFTPPANLSINATGTTGYFANWTVTAGNCTVNNSTSATTQIEVFDRTRCNVQANFLSYFNISTNYSTGITGISFRPSSAFSRNVEPVNQSSIKPLYVVNNTMAYSVIVVGKIASDIQGFSMKCSPNYSSGLAVPLTSNWSSLTSFVYSPPKCFQETANVSTTCGGLASGSYYAGSGTYRGYDEWCGIGFTCGEHLHHLWDEVYGYATPIEGGGGKTDGMMASGNVVYYVNYSKPSAATNSSQWYVNYGAPDVYANYSIPSGCWSQTPLQLAYAASSGGTWGAKECFNGSGWQVINNVSGTAYILTEEAMWWDMVSSPSNGSLYCWGDFSNPSGRNQSFTISIMGRT
jgi:hypothetical protein